MTFCLFFVNFNDSHMEEKLIKLTNTAYRVLEFLPESDPLKNRAKDKVLAIMDNLAFIFSTSGWASLQKDKAQNQLLTDIDALLTYLEIGRSQGWISAINYLIISNEYEKIKQEIGPIKEMTQKLPNMEFKEVAEPAPDSQSGITARQGKILEFLKEKEKAQVMDLQIILPDVTKRTIRRDLDELLQMRKITRLGDFNQVFYKLN